MNDQVPDPARLVGRLVYPLDWDGWRLTGGPQRVVGVLTRASGTWVRLESGRVHPVDQVEVGEGNGG